MCTLPKQPMYVSVYPNRRDLCLKYFVLKVSLLPSINKIKRDINSNRSHFLNCQIVSPAYLLPVNKKTIAKFSGIGVTRFHSLYIQILLVSTTYIKKIGIQCKNMFLL